MNFGLELVTFLTESSSAIVHNSLCFFFPHVVLIYEEINLPYKHITSF